MELVDPCTSARSGAAWNLQCPCCEKHLLAVFLWITARHRDFRLAPGQGPTSAPAEQPRPLALPVAILDRLALVVRLLAGGQRDLDLGPALLVEIDLQRHDGAALALDRADQRVDLLAMQQEFARPLALMIEAVAAGIFGDVGIDQPRLAAGLRDI